MKKQGEGEEWRETEVEGARERGEQRCDPSSECRTSSVESLQESGGEIQQVEGVIIREDYVALQFPP